MTKLNVLLISGAFAVLAPNAHAIDTAGTIVKPAPVISREEQAWHVGALGGTTNANGGSNLEYGIDVGMQPYIPFGVGAEVSKVDTGDLSRTKLLLRGDYNFGGPIPVIRHSYVGAAAGIAFDRRTDRDGNWLASGPLVGFDIPVTTINNKAVTLGAQARYLFVEGSASDAASLNGQVKFWF